MGCNQSSPHVDEKAGQHGRGGGIGSGGGANGASMRMSKKDMSKKDIDSRIDSIEETKTITFGGVSVRYAYLSQRGYYPDEPNKANQDSYAVVHGFAGRPADAFFGIFDGHGRDGDKCAQFAKRSLPASMTRAVEHIRGREATRLTDSANEREKMVSEVELSKEHTQEASLKAHLECNRRMHGARDIDDSLSGTTSISAYLHGNRNRITVSNVGDSRAVVGRSASTSDKGDGPSSSLKAFALSRDQTPYRRDERIRCRATGARILSLDQVEGLEPIDDKADENDRQYVGGADDEIILGEEIDEGGDPPRIWSAEGDYPGTAFTRSLGDAIAEDLGVCAEPEMLTRDLTPEDKIIVLASDGVFEFLTNQSVLDICAKFADPLEACRAVVAESYELWLQYELRTDDITMICMFVDSVISTKLLANQGGSMSKLGSASGDGPNGAALDGQVAGSGDKSDDDDDDLVTGAARPVRNKLSLQASRAMEQSRAKSLLEAADSAEDIDNFKFPRVPKTDNENAAIAEAIRASVIFKDATESQRELIYEAMEPMLVKKGDWIIKQGTVGDRFYVVDEGKFEVQIGGNAVHVYSGSKASHSHPSFGELALMYSAPRAASIVAQTDGKLWALHRYAFKKVLAGNKNKADREEVEKSMKKMDTFRKLSEEELSDLTLSLCEVKYGRGDEIVKEGEEGNAMYIISPGGTCESVSAGEGGSTTHLHGGDSFGEDILRSGNGGKYSSTVVATSKLTLYRLQKSDVKQVLGGRHKSEAGTNKA